MPTIRRTLGYHIVISGYGLWLPGDQRGHWSEAWDEHLGYIEPHQLHAGDSVRLRMAAERQKHPAVRLTAPMIAVVFETLARCAAESDWQVAASAIEPTHTHLLLTYGQRDVDKTVKWLKDQLTKDIHRRTDHAGPVWCKGSWRSFIFDEDVWQNTRRYNATTNAAPHKAATAGRGLPSPPPRDHRSRLYALSAGRRPFAAAIITRTSKVPSITPHARSHAHPPRHAARYNRLRSRHRALPLCRRA